MKLHPLSKRVIRALEPLPTGFQHQPVTLVDRTQLKLSETITNSIRRFRQTNPMIWDPWILKDGNIYRLFYLKGIEGQTPWWTISTICGAISTDLQTWQDLGTILEPELANDWESGRVCAGCTYAENGNYYLFYSAGGKELPHLKNEGIGLAISQDGLHFSRVSDRPLLMPNEMDQWYGHCNWNQHFHWRDPYLYKQEETGQYYLFICASSKTPGKFQGCIGLAVSDRISGTYKLLPPVVVAPANAAEAWAFYHMERPQVIYRNGQYHLFFSCFKMFLNPQWLQTVDQRKITNSTLHWYVADKIDGTYKPAMPGTSIVAGSERSGMYGTTLLEIAPSAWIAYGWYHRLHELEVSPTFQFLWRDDRPCLQPMTNADAATLNCLFK